MSARLTDEDARTRIRTSLDETLFVEAGAGSGKTKSLVDRVVALIDSGVELRSIAAITFTEKAAAELRERIRLELEARVAEEAAGGDQEAHARYGLAIEQIDTAAISTLHAFAQRILTEHAIEAGLPPNVEVLDEVASQIEFEDRWLRFRDQMLDTPALRRSLLLAFAVDVRLDDMRNLAVAFQSNWDLVADPGRLPWAAVEPPALDATPLLDGMQALLARRAECRGDHDRLLVYLDEEVEPYAQALAGAPDEMELLRLLVAAKPTLKCSNGKKDNWPDKASVAGELAALGDMRKALIDEIRNACVRRIATEVATFTLHAAHARRAQGRLEFHDLLVMAREMLRGDRGAEVRRRLRDRYQRLMLDEFQDTDPIQIDLAVLIAATPDQTASAWTDLEPEPGRVFFVGDPKQSIYRFRRADINLFLQASETFGNPPVALTTNFRTSPPVIEWVNTVFGRLIEAAPRSQPAYQPLDPAPTRTTPPDGYPVVVLGQDAHPYGMKADELREREAADVADAVLTALTWKVKDRSVVGPETWRPAALGDITILLPARTSLPTLEKALDDRGIPYRAETSSLVYSTREVRDVMAAARALADPTDQLALVAALRSPLFGCGDDDLFVFKKHGGAWDYTVAAPASLDETHPVVVAMAYLRSVHQQVPWLAPSELLLQLVADRRLLELGYASGRPRDLWRRLRFVIDQARAWSESEGGSLRHYLDWARLQASESARVAETVLPETDDESVRILTIHGSKGLEFPITIVSGMTSRSGGRTNRVEVAWPPTGPVAIKVGPAIKTPEFEAYQPIDEQMGYHERLRLLYVGCTRAQDHLVVSLHRTERKAAPGADRLYTNAELIAGASQDAPHQRTLAGAPTPLVLPPAAASDGPLIDIESWQAELARVLASSGRRRSVGASDLELDEALDADIAAGAQKGGRDLELPAWQKGRYGSAIGRAVHAVLQTVDLATGQGLAGAAAAQAAAEGVLGREADIERLARAALDAPVVQEAVTRQRWRETYVATPVGDRTLEGYIDLLFRAEDGLVVVDYKTASVSADIDRRVEGYRAQGGAYAVAVEQATGETVSRVVFVFLTPDGVVQRDLPELDDAKAAVVKAVDALA